MRLGGVYHDGNERHVPSLVLAHFASSLRIVDTGEKGAREWALVAVAVGATVLALIAPALAWLGVRRRSLEPPGLARAA